MRECLDHFIADDNPVRVIDAFVRKLDLRKLEFEGAEPAATGRPSYHSADLLKVYIYGYLNRAQSSRRLERECQRNLEMMWLTGRLRQTSRQSRTSGARTAPASRMCAGSSLCRDLKLFSQALVAIDGSKFKAVNARDKNFTAGKIDKRQLQIEESIHRYLVALDTADLTQLAEFEAKTTRQKGKIESCGSRCAYWMRSRCRSPRNQPSSCPVR